MTDHDSPPEVPKDQAGTEPESQESSSKPGKASQATQLVKLVEQRYRLALTERGEPFGVARDGPPVARLLRGDAASLCAELAAAYTTEHGKPPSSQALADALLVLEGRAQQADREPVSLRVARHGSQVVLDLGDTEATSVVVGADGWHITTAPVLFRRSPLTDPLPEPERGGELDELWALLNVAPDDRPLIAAWLVMVLLGDRPAPVLLLTGEQGSAKTSAGKLLAGLVDSPDALRAPPRDVEGWIVAADASRVVGVDNVSTVPPWLSDAICRTVTGEALVRRRLYTDSGVTRVTLRRPVVLTAIDTGGLRGDLADRLLTVELDRIPDERRRLDADVDTAWRQAHPRILGALCDLTAAVLTQLPTVKLDALPRMADYARVLGAVDRVLGTDGYANYVGQRHRLAEDVVDADPVASAVRVHVDRAGSWTGTAAELLRATAPDQPSREWPTTARGMAGKLTSAAPALRRLGYAVDPPGRTDRPRRWTLARETVHPTDVTDATDAQAADQQKRADGRADGRLWQPTDRRETDGQPSEQNSRSEGVSDGPDGSDGRTQPLSPTDDEKVARLRRTADINTRAAGGER